MRKVLLVLLVILPSLVHSQEIVPRKLFSDVIGSSIRKYKAKSKLASLNKDEERVHFLFDSLVNNVIKGSYIDNFKLRKFSGKKIEFYSFEKPVYLITSASWISPGSGEIPALNSIVNDHYNEIDFIILFWGSRKKIRKIKRQFSKNISILYVDEKENTNDHTIRNLKHSLGFPTSFIISENKEILDVRRLVHHHYSETFTNSYNQHFQNFMSAVSLLIKEEIIPD
jgi:hypothetical protein